ncbi:MAG TPA: polysaccharide biosynthesis/export family protein [Acidobacteriaceae bacterium]|nr:polysaccharide biosynthesis/export family protein [Acidobacteriaceae bacterium]
MKFSSAIFGITLVLASAGSPLLAQEAAGAAPATPPPAAALPPVNPQQPAVGPGANNDPSLSIRAEKALADAEPTANEEYTLGPGDEISLDFPGRPELTGKHVLGPDGRITLSLVGPVRLAGLTREDAAAVIVKALTPFYSDLAVTVAVDKYTSNRVRVLGYVQHPGEIAFEGQPTLLDAISRAGLISPTISKEGVTTAIGSGIPEICTIYRNAINKDGVVTNLSFQVQLRTLLMSGSSLADLRLRRDDIVFVPEPHELFVSVLGEVARPGIVALTPASTLVSVLAEAGCCGEGGGFKPKVHIIQPSTGKTLDISYKDLMSVGSQKEYTLHAGDVIVIPKSGFFKSTYVFQRLSPITAVAGIAAIGAF